MGTAVGHGGPVLVDQDTLDIEGEVPNSSRWRGVTYNKKCRKWQAVINTNGKHVHLGTFNEEEDAARIFDKAAIIARGAAAKLNFPVSDYQDQHGNLVHDAEVSTKLLTSLAAPVVKRPRQQLPGKQPTPGQLAARKKISLLATTGPVGGIDERTLKAATLPERIAAAREQREARDSSPADGGRSKRRQQGSSSEGALFKRPRGATEDSGSETPGTEPHGLGSTITIPITTGPPRNMLDLVAAAGALPGGVALNTPQSRQPPPAPPPAVAAPPPPPMLAPPSLPGSNLRPGNAPPPPLSSGPLGGLQMTSPLHQHLLALQAQAQSQVQARVRATQQSAPPAAPPAVPMPQPAAPSAAGAQLAASLGSQGQAALESLLAQQQAAAELAAAEVRRVSASGAAQQGEQAARAGGRPVGKEQARAGQEPGKAGEGAAQEPGVEHQRPAPAQAQAAEQGDADAKQEPLGEEAALLEHLQQQAHAQAVEAERQRQQAEREQQARAAADKQLQQAQAAAAESVRQQQHAIQKAQSTPQALNQGSSMPTQNGVRTQPQVQPNGQLGQQPPKPVQAAIQPTLFGPPQPRPQAQPQQQLPQLHLQAQAHHTQQHQQHRQHHHQLLQQQYQQHPQAAVHPSPAQARPPSPQPPSNAEVEAALPPGCKLLSLLSCKAPAAHMVGVVFSTPSGGAGAGMWHDRALTVVRRFPTQEAAFDHCEAAVELANTLVLSCHTGSLAAILHPRQPAPASTAVAGTPPAGAMNGHTRSLATALMGQAAAGGNGSPAPGTNMLHDAQLLMSMSSGPLSSSQGVDVQGPALMQQDSMRTPKMVGSARGKSRGQPAQQGQQQHGQQAQQQQSMQQQQPPASPHAQGMQALNAAMNMADHQQGQQYFLVSGSGQPGQFMLAQQGPTVGVMDASGVIHELPVQVQGMPHGATISLPGPGQPGAGFLEINTSQLNSAPLTSLQGMSDHQQLQLGSPAHTQQVSESLRALLGMTGGPYAMQLPQQSQGAALSALSAGGLSALLLPTPTGSVLNLGGPTAGEGGAGGGSASGSGGPAGSGQPMQLQWMAGAAPNQVQLMQQGVGTLNMATMVHPSQQQQPQPSGLGAVLGEIVGGQAGPGPGRHLGVLDLLKHVDLRQLSQDDLTAVTAGAASVVPAGGSTRQQSSAGLAHRTSTAGGSASAAAAAPSGARPELSGRGSAAPS